MPGWVLCYCLSSPKLQGAGVLLAYCVSSPVKFLQITGVEHPIHRPFCTPHCPRPSSGMITAQHPLTPISWRSFSYTGRFCATRPRRKSTNWKPRSLFMAATEHSPRPPPSTLPASLSRAATPRSPAPATPRHPPRAFSASPGSSKHSLLVPFKTDYLELELELIRFPARR